MDLPNFEDDAREAVLDELEEYARNTIAPEVQQRANDILLAYGREHDYDVQPIIDAGETLVERRGNTVVVRWGWPEPAIYFERGTADGVTRKPDSAEVLSFVWEDPPDWVREEFEREGDGYRVFLQEATPSGLPAARFIRDTLNWLRGEFA